MAPTSDTFYDTLPRIKTFADLAQPEQFTPLPEDWVVCCTDIVDSRGLIAAGKYRTVNMISAAVITAMMNALSHQPFPYVFAGDGASFALPREYELKARDTLAHLRAWVDREFAITLRAAMVPVKWIRDEGYDVSVARYALAAEADYAMFNGGGIAWAEQQMKLGGFEIAEASSVEPPDLSGLSCRWRTVASQNGTIVSLLVLPGDHNRSHSFSAVVTDILDIAAELARDGHPVPEAGPPPALSSQGLGSEAKLLRQGSPVFWFAPGVWIRSLLVWLVFVSGLRIGGFNPKHYRRTLSRNADFRKFDDGLKMTLDCTPDIRDRLLKRLQHAQVAGEIRYGWHEQADAVVTCVVPSAFRDDHIHFVDGAAGGYTEAAHALK